MPDKDPKDMSTAELEKSIEAKMKAEKDTANADEQKKFAAKAQKKLETSSAQKKDAPAKTEPTKGAKLEEGKTPVAKTEVVPPVKTENKDNDKVGKWLDSKGLPKDPLVIAKHYRELEREFHKSRQEKKPEVPPVQVTPAPVQEPPKGNLFEMISKDLGIDSADVERVARIAHFISEQNTSQRIKPIEDELKRLKTNSTKSNEVMELAVTEPAFSHPDVQKEVEAQIRKDPAIFEKSLPITEAYNRALCEIGRKVLLESRKQETDDVPDAPPKTLTGSVMKPSPQQEKPPSKMTVKELEEQLNARGIRTEH